MCTGLWVKREEGGRMALIPGPRIFPIIFYKSGKEKYSYLLMMREEGEAGLITAPLIFPLIKEGRRNIVVCW